MIQKFSLELIKEMDFQKGFLVIILIFNYQRKIGDGYSCCSSPVENSHFSRN